MKHRVLAVGLDFALRAGAGLVLASPLVAAVASTGITRFPEGDRLLFEPGGLMLVEVARTLWSAVVPLIQAELVMGLVLALGLVVPYAVLLVALSRREPRTLSDLFGTAMTRVPPLVALQGLTLLAQSAALLALATFAAGLREALVGATSRRADLAFVAVLALGGLVVLGLGALRDLSSAACVEETLGSPAALRRGVAALLRAPGAVLSGFGAALVAASACVGVGALLTGALDVGRPGAFRVALVLVLHLAVLLGRSVCRALWLQRALGLVEPKAAAD
ncbi:MAG TPA: hypothetical protein VFV94_10695 [Polyangiaceae bacterium]|jgi:hypothetical protein|nr:hypothetical protein [Polyangiaceae bacterium]